MGKPDNIVQFAGAGSRTPTRFHCWEAIQTTAIFPAFRLCSETLAREGIEPQVCENTERHARPFTILFWSGRGSLQGARVGLHFTYGGNVMRFDLSVVKDVDLIRSQATFHTEFFEINEPELAAKVIRRCAFGMGKALQMEAATLPAAKWTVSELPRFIH